MNWVLENFQVILAVAGVIAYWLVQTRKQKELRKQAEEELGRQPTPEELAERMREVQEEIRRKIAERQGRPPTEEELEDETMFPTPPVVRRAPPALPPRPAAPPPLPPVVVSKETAPGAEEMERALSEQRRFAEQLERLEAQQRAVAAAAAVSGTSEAASAAAFTQVAPGSVAEAAAQRRAWLFDDLRNRDSLQRAIMLREILGPAKGLQ